MLVHSTESPPATSQVQEPNCKTRWRNVLSAQPLPLLLMHTLQAIDWKQHHIQKSSSLTSTWHHAKEPKATRVLLSQLSSLLVRDGTEGASGQSFRMPRPPATKPRWPSETVTAEQVGWGISGKLAISNSASSLRAPKALHIWATLCRQLEERKNPPLPPPFSLVFSILPRYWTKGPLSPYPLPCPSLQSCLCWRPQRYFNPNPSHSFQILDVLPGN